MASSISSSKEYSSCAEPKSDGGSCTSVSEVESGGVKAPSSGGGLIAGVARGSPNLCRGSADLVVLSDVVSSSELDELEGLVGLALRLDRLLLLAGEPEVTDVGVGPLWGSFFPACPC